MIDKICKEYSTCQRCSFGKGVGTTDPPLRVFYRGALDAKVCIIAEGPGANEIKAGIPLIGDSGKLLTKILAHAHIPESDCFFINSFVCSDDGKKKPTREVLVACNDRLKRTIEALNPKLVICLGKYAMLAYMLSIFGTLIDEKLNPLKHFLGGMYDTANLTKWCVDYHPAYLIRNPKEKFRAADRWKKIGEIYQQINIKIGV